MLVMIVQWNCWNIATYDNPQSKQDEFALQLLHLKYPSHKADSLSEFSAS